MHHGVVAGRVKGLAQRFNLLHPQLFQHGHELPADHFHTLAVGVALFKLGKAPLQIIQHLQEGLHGVGLSIAVQALLFLGGAFAVVVVFRRQTQIFVAGVGHHLGQLLHFFHLIPGNGEGLLRRFRRRLLLGLGLRGVRVFLFLLVFLIHILAHVSWSSLGGSWFFPNMRPRLSAK